MSSIYGVFVNGVSQRRLEILIEPPYSHRLEVKQTVENIIGIHNARLQKSTSTETDFSEILIVEICDAFPPTLR